MKSNIHKRVHFLNAKPARLNGSSPRQNDLVGLGSGGRSTLNASAGFTILFAVLVGGLLFSIGLSVAHLAIREVLLGAAGRESNFAFFAADTGVECALYWDINVGRDEVVFPSSEDETGRGTIFCNGPQSIPVSVIREGSTAATSTFMLAFVPKGCAIVAVGKTVSGSTVIESRGRNDCGAGVNPGRVERALRVRY